MNQCLWCHDKIIWSVGWETASFPAKERVLCTVCTKRLSYLPKQRCSICSRPTNKTKTCQDCENWKQRYQFQDSLTKNHSVFRYNEFLQEVITKWKYRGDFILGDIFKDIVYFQYKKVLVPLIGSQAVIIPIPLSAQRQKERAFNQAEVLANFMAKNTQDVLQRRDNTKQAKKSRYARLSTNNPFMLTTPIKQTALLVDDIYTTGRTIRHAADQLKEKGCPNVYAFTLIRG